MTAVAFAPPGGRPLCFFVGLPAPLPPVPTTSFPSPSREVTVDAPCTGGWTVLAVACESRGRSRGAVRRGWEGDGSGLRPPQRPASLLLCKRQWPSPPREAGPTVSLGACRCHSPPSRPLASFHPPQMPLSLRPLSSRTMLPSPPTKTPR